MKINTYIYTFGCQMNVRDSEVIAGLLVNNGYQITINPDEADVILFNTCSVRQHAEDKVWSELGRFKKKDKQNRPIIGLVGCMAQNYKEKVFTRAPYVDFIVGPNDLRKIPQIIDNLINQRSPLTQLKIWQTNGTWRPEEIYHSGFYQDKEHAYVIISEGCSNYCSYCIVPYVRGPLRNRNYKDILREIEEAIDKGIRKFTLLGQNVNAYEFDGINFNKLIRLVNEIKGLEEFGFITSHPKDATEEFFKAISDCQKLKQYLHLPVQSGSDRILKLMNRGYTRGFYLSLVDRYRKIVKRGSLSTDIIVGFPSETEEDFLDTYNLVKDVQFNNAFIFKYSVRPNTEAEKLPDNVDKKEKERRHRLILELQKNISKGLNEN
ncbi:MAG: tRNA (N6-isopentenyl adenosine(37)-C2)-methylthiotransferase MiaB [Candidatus Omnitrophica bacterium]|nr:tRNA (N6-isopentenyl adenosine(37)-C2)-methylthiotransferase MiaB [Candidatus Omnitrophota bacterium]